MSWQDAFDRIVCITLRDVVEARRPIVLQEFARIGVPADKIEFFVVDRHPQGGRKGCFDSHVRVLQAVYDGDPTCERLLVLEDDVKLAPSFSHSAMAACARHMVANRDWDVFYLGHGGTDWVHLLHDALFARMIGPHIVEKRCILTHALVVSRRGMRKIIGAGLRELASKSGQDVTHYDVFVAGLPDARHLCAVPMQFDQRWCWGTSNMPASTTEALVRKVQCYIERTDLLALYSFEPYHRFGIMTLMVTVAVMAGVVVAKTARQIKRLVVK